LGTLLFDLLTPSEEAIDMHTRHLRFDIGLLGRRLAGAVRWLRSREDMKGLKIGFFGASTGGAAALVAAAELRDQVGAVVSRGGRPDLAGDALRHVRAPVLLIVGGRDHMVIELNRRAYDELSCEKKLQIVPGATHLFEEPGTLETVGRLAADWFAEHLN
jgi:dienelactone hydrolase